MTQFNAKQPVRCGAVEITDRKVVRRRDAGWRTRQLPAGHTTAPQDEFVERESDARGARAYRTLLGDDATAQRYGILGYLTLEIPGALLVERWSARKWFS